MKNEIGRININIIVRSFFFFLKKKKNNYIEKKKAKYDKQNEYAAVRRYSENILVPSVEDRGESGPVFGVKNPKRIAEIWWNLYSSTSLMRHYTVGCNKHEGLVNMLLAGRNFPNACFQEAICERNKCRFILRNALLHTVKHG